GGIVYMASPMKRGHGRYGTRLIRWLGEYEEATPDTEVLDNATNILGDESEPEPDGCLFICRNAVGRPGRTRPAILTAPPSKSPRSARAPNPPICTARKRIRREPAFANTSSLPCGNSVSSVYPPPRQVSRTGTRPGRHYRSEVFPGLWLDARALL